MNKNFRKIDIYFTFFILLLFVLSSFLYFNSAALTLLDYIMLGITFLLMIFTYFIGLIGGVLTSAFTLFIYASYILYGNITKGRELSINTFLWIAAVPLGTIIIGNIHSHIVELHNRLNKYESQYMEYVTIDETTEFHNKRAFYTDLEKEMSLSRRHKHPFTLMIIKVLYYEELLGIFGENKMIVFRKELSEAVNQWTRFEDKKYSLDRNLIAIIMPNTEAAGAEVVRGRIKESIKELDFRIKEKGRAANIEVRLAILQYDKDYKSAMEFKTLCERELEYDI